MIRPTYILNEGEQKRAKSTRLLLLYPMTSAVDQLDASHLRRRLRPHDIERARRRIGAPIVNRRRRMTPPILEISTACDDDLPLIIAPIHSQHFRLRLPDLCGDLLV